MTRLSELNYLLACLGEECGEVQQVVGKASRFGIYDRHPKHKAYNWELLRKELHDVLAVFELLADNLGESSTIDRDLINAKQLKLITHSEYSVERDCLQRKLGETE